MRSWIGKVAGLQIRHLGEDEVATSILHRRILLKKKYVRPLYRFIFLYKGCFVYCLFYWTGLLHRRIIVVIKNYVKNFKRTDQNRPLPLG